MRTKQVKLITCLVVVAASLSGCNIQGHYALGLQRESSQVKNIKLNGAALWDSDGVMGTHVRSGFHEVQFSVGNKTDRASVPVTSSHITYEIKMNPPRLVSDGSETVLAELVRRPH